MLGREGAQPRVLGRLQLRDIRGRDHGVPLQVGGAGLDLLLHGPGIRLTLGDLDPVHVLVPDRVRALLPRRIPGQVDLLVRDVLHDLVRPVGECVLPERGVIREVGQVLLRRRRRERNGEDVHEIVGRLAQG